jgi:hypothetical protein
VKLRLMAIMMVSSLTLTAPAHAQSNSSSGGNSMFPIVAGAVIGGAVGMLIWPMAAPMGAGVMASAGAPEMAAGMGGAGPAGWRAIVAARTLVGAGIGAIAGYLYAR